MLNHGIYVIFLEKKGFIVFMLSHGIYVRLFLEKGYFLCCPLCALNDMDWA